MVAYPLIGFLHPRIVLRDAAVNHALDPGVGHTAVAGETLVRRTFRLGLTPSGGTVNEAAVINLGGPRLVVVFSLEILTATDEDQGLLVGRIILRDVGLFQGVQKELGIRQIG